MKRVLFACALTMAVTAVAGAQDRRVRVTPEPQGRRVAIVIGNNAYPDKPLKNSVNDANAMSRELSDAGFQVDLVLDASLRDLARHVDAFLSGLQQGDVALVYYSGHGMQIEGENYLVPVDFKAGNEVDAKYDAFSANRIVERLNASRARLSMVVLDACRDNPFRAARGGANGLAQMEPGPGTIILLATAQGRTADDNRPGDNGLFTTYLLDSMRQPGLTVEQVFFRTSKTVKDASESKQVPAVFSSAIDEFYFFGGAGSSASAASGPSAPRPGVDPASAVNDLLARYRRAYESMDADALVQIYPAFKGRAELESKFRDFQGVAMALGSPEIKVTSDRTAVATLIYSITYTAKSGRVENTKPLRATFEFEKSGSVWVIGAIRFR